MSVTLDTLAFDSELWIQREIDLPVSLSLCAKPGVRLADVAHGRVVPARDRAVPGVAVEEAAEGRTRAPSHSTAEAASEVAKSKRRDLAAICNAPRGRGLRARGASPPRSRTIPRTRPGSCSSGRGIPAPTGHDKTTIVCFQREDRPGSLLAILQEFAARGDQPHQARVAPDQAQPRRLLLLHRHRRVTSPTSWSPTGCATSRRSRRR